MVDSALMIHKVVPMYVCSNCNVANQSGPVDNIENNIVESHVEILDAGKREGRIGLLDRLELAGMLPVQCGRC